MGCAGVIFFFFLSFFLRVLLFGVLVCDGGLLLRVGWSFFAFLWVFNVFVV